MGWRACRVRCPISKPSAPVERPRPVKRGRGRGGLLAVVPEDVGAALAGDGRNDFIWGHGHNYGLYWEERRDDNKDGSTNWRHYLIDDKVSQNHALVWEDLDRDGEPDLITGRRVRAHSGNDPGDNEPGCLYFYKWNRAERRFTKHLIVDGGPGTGLQIRLADFDGNGWKDIAVAGKSGTHILWNDGK